jgi:copper chaperone NosL
MTATRTVLLLGAAALCVAGCGRSDSGEPPAINYGVSVCIECDMIISDDRFASAAVIRDERGRLEPLLFDDVGDQIRYERRHADQTVVARWVHDADTSEWLDAERAFYVRSMEIHTPMASGIAAFGTQAAASERADAVGATVLSFSEVWGLNR